MTAFRNYRGPIITALVLWVATWVWGAAHWNGEQKAYRDQALRPAVMLAMDVGVLLDRDPPADDAALESLRDLFRDRLELRPPLLFATLVRNDVPIATSGSVPSDRPGEPGADDRVIYRRPLGLFETPPGPPPRPGEPPDARPPPPESPPFRWLPGGPAAARGGTLDRFELIVGIDTSMPRFRFRRQAMDLATILMAGWAAIGALTFAWVHGIRRKMLEADLAVERQQRAHLEELGLAAAGLAHETKNPLGIILGLADRIHRDPESGRDTRSMAEQIMDSADRAAARVGEFLTFARSVTPRLADVPARSAIQRVAGALQSDFLAAGVRLDLRVDDVVLRCDGEMLGQVLVNLLLNSLQASAAGSTVTVRVERRRGTALLAVEDQGRGIPAEVRADIFKPYVTGRPEGHGLGLTIVKRIVDQHGWSIEVAGEPGQGTRMTITGIPLAAGEEGSA